MCKTITNPFASGITLKRFGNTTLYQQDAIANIEQQRVAASKGHRCDR